MLIIWEGTNNRELSVLIWSCALLLLVVFAKSVRNALLGVVGAFLQPTILKLLFASFVYVTTLCLVAYSLGIWVFADLKATLLWYIFAGFASISISITGEHSSLRQKFIKWLKSNIRITLILEGLAALYSFSLIVELLLVPFITICALISAISSIRAKTEGVQKFFDLLLILVGFCMLFFAAYKFGYNLESQDISKLSKGFLLSPLLSLVFLPFCYAVHLYSKYQVIFGRLEVKIDSGPRLDMIKLECIKAFKLNTQLASEWVGCVYKFDLPDKKALLDTVKVYKNARKKMLQPTPVPLSDGWSPEFSLNLLSQCGLKPFIYQPLSDVDWGGSTTRRYLGDESEKNTIGFRVDGIDGLCHRLKIDLDLMSDRNEGLCIEAFLDVAQHVCIQATRDKLPVGIENSFTSQKSTKVETQDFIFSAEFNDYRLKHSGLTVDLVIQHKKALAKYQINMNEFWTSL